jgi:CDP-paratose 2-epimerase
LSPALITGGAGFVGTNLADRLLREGERVRVLDDLSRPGVERNLEWLESQHGSRLQVEVADLRDEVAVRRAARRASEVFHFAAQVAVTTSLDDPMHDARVNLDGTLTLLEEARRSRLPLVFTSTNKVYGNLDDVALEEHDGRWAPADETLRTAGVDEDRPLHFRTPYGCSKGAADQYVLDYAASYGLATTVFRMSCIYGPHQFGNEDQGWVAHFLIRALEGEPVTIYGDGRQVRDVLFVGDLLEAFMCVRRRRDAVAGRAFNIGGGPANAVSLRDVLAMIEDVLGEPPEVDYGAWRQGDQRWYVSDTRRFEALTGWRPAFAPRDGLAALRGWLEEEARPAVAVAGATG